NPFVYAFLGEILLTQNKIEDAVATFDVSLKIDPNLISSYQRLAFISTVKKDFSTAVSYLQKASTLDPSNPELYYEIGLIDIQQGKTKEAISMFEKASELNKQSVKELIMLSRIYEKMGKPDEAISIIENSTKSQPSNPSLNLLLADLYVKQEKFSEALAAYDKAFDHNQEAGTGGNILGLIYLVMGKHKEALAAFESSLGKNPEDTNLYCSLAILQNLKMDYQKALASVDQALRINDSNKFLYLVKANIFACQGKYREASEMYVKCNIFAPELMNKKIDIAHYYQADPQFIGSHLPLMATYMKQGWMSRVREEESRLLEKSPDNPLVSYLMGQFFANTDTAKAREYFEKTLKADPRLASVHLALGDIYYSLDKGTKVNDNNEGKNDYLRKAIHEYDSYLQHYEDDVDKRIKIALLFEKANNYKMAIDNYQKAIKADPHALVALNQLAWILADKGIDLDRAVQYAKKAVDLNPDNGNIVDTLGWAFYKGGDKKEAIRQFEKAANLNKKNPSIHYHLALAYYENNQKKDALESLDTALKITENFPEIREARALWKKLQ
ncbi:MAG: tetratricopeptide repeat protein, partial [bacterium]